MTHCCTGEQVKGDIVKIKQWLSSLSIQHVKRFVVFCFLSLNYLSIVVWRHSCSVVRQQYRYASGVLKHCTITEIIRATGSIGVFLSPRVWNTRDCWHLSPSCQTNRASSRFLWNDKTKIIHDDRECTFLPRLRNELQPLCIALFAKTINLRFGFGTRTRTQTQILENSRPFGVCGSLVHKIESSSLERREFSWSKIYCTIDSRAAYRR